MGIATLKFEIELASITCGQCGGTYAINERYRADRQVDGGCWTCPYCRASWGYANNNENARLRKELDEQRARTANALSRANLAVARADEAAARADKADKALQRHKKRTAAGTCPCCKRTFQQLQRHMASKHPGYAK